MSNEPRMMKCNNIECGGKLQPHSFDSTVQNGDRRRTGMDCDGPCSQRRVDEWKARYETKAATPTWADKLGRMYVLPDWTYVCLETGLTDCAVYHCSMHGWRP